MAMIEELQILLSLFLGLKAHIRCYAHTINLTAKGVLQPFEPTKPKRKDNGDGDGDDSGAGQTTGDNEAGREELEAELQDLEENGVQDDDDEEGLVDVIGEMSIEEWDAAVAPIHNTLVKVSNQFQIIDSEYGPQPITGLFPNVGICSN